jgi:hypothetical protein
MTDTWTRAQTDLIMLFIACLAMVLLSTFLVAGERELSAGLETYCVLQPVESSTTEREKVNGVLPRSEISYVNYRTRRTMSSRNY